MKNNKVVEKPFGSVALAIAVAVLLPFAALADGQPKLPEVPAKIKLSVEPKSVAPGQQARLTVELEPIEGVKINQYPKIKVSVPEQEGLVAKAEIAVGNDSPPPPEKLKSNYFETLEPLELTLEVDGAATSGRHEIDGKVTYFYCMPASGFCAPKRVPVKIPISVQ